MQFSIMKTFKKSRRLYIALALLFAQLDCLCGGSGCFNMKQIQLTQGQVALVDDEDFEFLSQRKWHAAKWKHGFYARSHNGWTNGKQNKLSKMHRVVMKIDDPAIFIDHIDGNTLNNQKSNLRKCSPAENQKNQFSRKGKSNYLGVNVQESKRKLASGEPVVYKYYRSEIRVNTKGIFLGQFPFTPEGEKEAAKTYDEAAKKYHGEFANLNFKD